MSQKILVMQTSSVAHTFRVLEVVDRLFGHPRTITVLAATNGWEEEEFANHHLVTDVLTYQFEESKFKAWRVLQLWAALWREHYSTVVALFDMDPNWDPAKWFAFLVRGRKLIFNENFDCFYATPGNLYRFLQARLREGRLTRSNLLNTLLSPLAYGWRSVLRSVLLPFVFLYLLSVMALLHLRALRRGVPGERGAS